MSKKISHRQKAALQKKIEAKLTVEEPSYERTDKYRPKERKPHGKSHR